MGKTLQKRRGFPGLLVFGTPFGEANPAKNRSSLEGLPGDLDSRRLEENPPKKISFPQPGQALPPCPWKDRMDGQAFSFKVP